MKRSRNVTPDKKKLWKKAKFSSSDVSLNQDVLSLVFSFLPLEDMSNVQHVSSTWRNALCIVWKSLRLRRRCAELFEIEEVEESKGLLQAIDAALASRVKHLKNEVFFVEARSRFKANAFDFDLIDAKYSDIYLFTDVEDFHHKAKYQTEDFTLVWKDRIKGNVTQVLIRKNKYLWREVDGQLQHLLNGGTGSTLAENIDDFVWNLCIEMTDQNEAIIWKTEYEEGSSIKKLTKLGKQHVEYLLCAFVASGLDDSYISKLLYDYEAQGLLSDFGFDKPASNDIPFENKFRESWNEAFFSNAREAYPFKYERPVLHTPVDITANRFLNNEIINNIYEFMDGEQSRNFSGVNRATRELYLRYEDVGEYMHSRFGLIAHTNASLEELTEIRKFVQIRLDKLIQKLYCRECAQRHSELQDELPFKFNMDDIKLISAAFLPLYKMVIDASQNYHGVICQVEERTVDIAFEDEIYIFWFATEKKIWDERRGSFLDNNTWEIVTDPEQITINDDPYKWTLKVHEFTCRLDNYYDDTQNTFLQTKLLPELAYICMRLAGYTDNHFVHAFSQSSPSKRSSWVKRLIAKHAADIPEFETMFRYTWYD